MKGQFQNVRDALELVAQNKSPTIERVRSRVVLQHVTPPSVLLEMLDSIDKKDAEILELHQQLAEARLDAKTGWNRYKNANAIANGLMAERADVAHRSQHGRTI